MRVFIILVSLLKAGQAKRMLNTVKGQGKAFVCYSVITIERAKQSGMFASMLSLLKMPSRAFVGYNVNLIRQNIDVFI